MLNTISMPQNSSKVLAQYVTPIPFKSDITFVNNTRNIMTTESRNDTTEKRAVKKRLGFFGIPANTAEKP